MSSTYKVITPPSVEPISLADAKQYLRVDFSDDDMVIANIIIRAREYAEQITGRALATQTIQQMDTIERPEGGTLSGPIRPGPSWYVYSEQLGANPFGPAQYYYDLAMPPIQASLGIVVNTKVTAFDAWSPFALTTNLDGSANFWIDDTSEPARLYLMDPITANFWQFIYTCGYTSSYLMPPDLLQPLYELIGHLYIYREGTEDSDQFQSIIKKFLLKRVDSV